MSTPVPTEPVAFADTPYDVLTDVTLPDERVLSAGSSTTPADMGLAENIPVVHALVVAGKIWPTGVDR